MNGIIIYKGKYGATHQYAQWLGEELGLKVNLANNVKPVDLAAFDFFILGSSVYIGKLQLEDWLAKNESVLSGKKIFFFLVAGTPPSETEKLMEYIRKGIPALVFHSCEYYFLPGKLDLKVLSWKDRFILKMGARLAKNPTDRANMLTPYDHVKKENLAPMLENIRRFRLERKAV